MGNSKVCVNCKYLNQETKVCTFWMEWVPLLESCSKFENMKNKQTAVEWLWSKASSGEHILPEDFEQANKMFEQQLSDAFISGGKSRHNIGVGLDFKTFEQYYKETYENKS